MADSIDIAAGLRVPRQVPLDTKGFCVSEAVLSNLGPQNNLAFTYHDGLIVTCNQERTSWEWREAAIGEEGLVENNFTYPVGWIVFGVNYSLKNFNFFSTLIEKRSPATPFKFLQKGFGNVNLLANEVGDIFCGWSNDGLVRYSEAIYQGGNINDSDNFIPLVQTEI
jgi:hypothetical protein